MELLKSFDVRFLPQDKKNRNLLVAILVGGGATGLIFQLLKPRVPHTTVQPSFQQQDIKKPRVAVDGVFLKRLTNILKIIVPSWRSVEMIHLIILTFLLFARTMLSIKIADITGLNAQYLVEKRWMDTMRGIIMFAAVGVPSSIVNSGLKYETSLLSLRFRKRLSERINAEYLNGVNFYKASNLGSNRIDNADQRVTADIEKFCDSLSNLYTTIFKPVLDVILFTQKLTAILGFRGPLMLFAYYFVCGIIKRNFMPAFGKLTALDSQFEGNYRTAHLRLITNAEEVAFYDGSKRERVIVNKLFNDIYNHAKFFQWLKFLVGIFDNFLVKYGTSITGYLILCLPIYFPAKGSTASTAELTKDYVRNRQLLISLGTAVGQLVVLANKVTSLAGITSRVSELLEMVRHLDKVGVQPFQVRDDEKSDQQQAEAPSHQEFSVDMTKWLEEWRLKGEVIREQREKERKLTSPQNLSKSHEGGQIIEGKFIKFDNVSIVSPDGKLLVKDLTFEVKLHQNVMVTGPNGSGKSSLFRILGELWPLHNGTVIKPRKEDILFVPQKPYLVQGTLRDQVIYPHSVEDMKRIGVTDDDLAQLLSLVDPAKTILKEWKWDDVRDWFNTFSGGQKQRVAMARLFYHRPLFAILDECTSAVSDEVEGKIYETCKQLGITLFTVSHRPNLKRFHDNVLRFDGRGDWEWTTV